MAEAEETESSGGSSSSRKRGGRTVTDGVAHVHASFNNTIITIDAKKVTTESRLRESFRSVNQNPVARQSIASGSQKPIHGSDPFHIDVALLVRVHQR